MTSAAASAAEGPRYCVAKIRCDGRALQAKITGDVCAPCQAALAKTGKVPPALRSGPTPASEVGQLPIELVGEAPWNPRKRFDDMDEFVASIRAHGVLQPGIVRPVDDGRRFEIVAGARRYRAAKLAGLKTFPAVVVRDYSVADALVVNLVENLQRSTLHPIEEADGLLDLKEKHGLSVEDLQDRTGLSRSSVYNRLKLARVDAETRAALQKSNLTFSAALEFARIPGEEARVEAIRDAGRPEAPRLSARGAKALVHERYHEKQTTHVRRRDPLPEPGPPRGVEPNEAAWRNFVVGHQLGPLLTNVDKIRTGLTLETPGQRVAAFAAAATRTAINARVPKALVLRLVSALYEAMDRSAGRESED